MLMAYCFITKISNKTKTFVVEAHPPIHFSILYLSPSITALNISWRRRSKPLVSVVWANRDRAYHLLPDLACHLQHLLLDL